MSASEENSPTIKVLHFIDSGGLYGAEKMLLALVSEQVNQGISPMILSAGELDEPEKALEAEAKKLGLPIKPWRMKPGFNLKSTRDIVSWAQANGYTHFHSHGFKFNVLLALLSLVGLSQKLITTVHGYVGGKRFSKLWVYEILDGLALWRFNKVVVVSEPMLSLSVIKRLPKSKITTINNGISLNPKPVSLPHDISEFCKKYEYSIIAVGRLSPEKGFNYLLDAVSNLESSTRKSLAVVIVGEGPCRDSLELSVRASGMDNVMLAGYRENAGEFMEFFDALLMPSLTEGLPITLLEAMRAKVAICASRVGGIPSVLSEEGGCLIEPRNENDIAIFIDRLVSDREAVRVSNNRNRNIFEKNYSSHVMAEKYKKSVY